MFQATGATRTTTLTRTTSARQAAAKKPQELVRKAKTTKIEKPMENGVSTIVTEQIIVSNAVNDEGEAQLAKDNSPIDNKLIVEANITD